jgi:hypothetical protein
VDVDGFDVPDSLTIVIDRPVSGKLPHPRNIEDRSPSPFWLVCPQRADLVLAINVGLVIGQQEKWIVLQKVIDDRPEKVLVAVA